MEIAAAGLFRAKWTDAIQEEWIAGLLKNRPDLNRGQLNRTRDLMTKAIPDSLVTGYEPLCANLNLPDQDDNHVLAAAIRCGADAIITFNLKDFPHEILHQFAIEGQHPDEFLLHQFGLNPAAVVLAAQRCRERLKNPPVTVERYLAALDAQTLPQTVARLREYAAVL